MDTGLRRYDGVLCDPLLVLLNIEFVAIVHWLKCSKSQHIVLLARFFPGQQCAYTGMTTKFPISVDQLW
jgi:hypothetical protein